jgi:hypothetical protein
LKYWIDTEFHERPNTIELISIALVADDGREYYAHSADYDAEAAHNHDFLRKEVLPHLTQKPRVPLSTIRAQLIEFLDPVTYSKPEFWGYYCAYDWVVFCWIFGPMVDLPKGFPMYCNDIKQLANAKGNPKMPRFEGTAHDALDDARRQKKMYEYLEPLPYVGKGVGQ